MIFRITEDAILEGLFSRKSKHSKNKYNDKKNNKQPYRVIHVDSPSKSIFDKLYNNDALTAEGMAVNDDADLEKVNAWFRDMNNVNGGTLDIYVIKGKIMNSYYHLTGDNQYSDDLTIVCIDWVSIGVKSPYKGSFRWFGDVVDNNERRENEKE